MRTFHTRYVVSCAAIVSTSLYAVRKHRTVYIANCSARFPTLPSYPRRLQAPNGSICKPLWFRAVRAHHTIHTSVSACLLRIPHVLVARAVYAFYAAYDRALFACPMAISHPHMLLCSSSVVVSILCNSLRYSMNAIISFSRA
jgi:hypothetical protein